MFLLNILHQVDKKSLYPTQFQSFLVPYSIPILLGTLLNSNPSWYPTQFLSFLVPYSIPILLGTLFNSNPSWYPIQFLSFLVFYSISILLGLLHLLTLFFLIQSRRMAQNVSLFQTIQKKECVRSLSGV